MTTPIVRDDRRVTDYRWRKNARAIGQGWTPAHIPYNCGGGHIHRVHGWVRGQFAIAEYAECSLLINTADQLVLCAFETSECAVHGALLAGQLGEWDSDKADLNRLSYMAVEAFDKGGLETTGTEYLGMEVWRCAKPNGRLN